MRFGMHADGHTRALTEFQTLALRLYLKPEIMCVAFALRPARCGLILYAAPTLLKRRTILVGCNG